MPAATPHFRFSLKTLFTAVTVVSLHLGVYLWDVDAFVTLLPCTLLAVGMALVRRRRAEWQAAFAFGAAFGTSALALTLGALVVVAVRPEFSTAELVFKPSGDLLAGYGRVGIACSVAIASCLVLAYGAGVPVWRFVVGYCDGHRRKERSENVPPERGRQIEPRSM